MHRFIRILVTGMIIITLLNSVFFVILAVIKSVHAYLLVLHGETDEVPGVHVAESLDGFMLALFFIIVAMGLAKLFLPGSRLLGDYDLPWLKIENFSQLKYIMWEVLLTTIFVLFATEIFINIKALTWYILIFPASILMLAFAYKLLKQGH